MIYWYNDNNYYDKCIVYEMLLCSCHYHIHMSIITQGGYTALMLASWNGMTEVVAQLVKAGSALDLQDKVCISVYK